MAGAPSALPLLGRVFNSRHPRGWGWQKEDKACSEGKMSAASISQAWWQVSPALGGFGARGRMPYGRVSYTVSSRTAWATQDFVVKKRQRGGAHVKGLAQSSCPSENETSKPDEAERGSACLRYQWQRQEGRCTFEKSQGAISRLDLKN